MDWWGLGTTLSGGTVSDSDGCNNVRVRASDRWAGGWAVGAALCVRAAWSNKLLNDGATAVKSGGAFMVWTFEPLHVMAGTSVLPLLLSAFGAVALLPL